MSLNDLPGAEIILLVAIAVTRLTEAGLDRVC
jgi:hypothetical protein